MADERKMRRLVVAGLVGATVVFLGLAVLVSGESVPGIIEVEARGNDVLPGLPHGVEVARLRIAGALTIHVDLTRGRVEDAVTGFFLTAMATAAVMTGLLLSSVGAARWLVSFYLISAAAIGFLAADELLSLHETVGHNLRPLVPGMEKPDNLITSVYALMAVASLVAFRRALWRGTLQRMLFGAAAAVFLLTVAFDALSLRGEEPAEVLAATCAGAGFLSLLAGDLRTCLGLGSPEEAAPDAKLPASETTTAKRLREGAGA
jgi:hypothetical protein